MDAVERQGLTGQHQDEIRTLQLEFKGSGSEYFRIWIVNLLLNIVTLGIYSAWAKVRRNKYLYANTSLDGSSFEYHGNPIAILKGRIIAGILLGGYYLTARIAPAVAGLILLFLFAVAPWLVWKSLQFRLYNSSYRGIRFGFRGSVGKAYMTFLVWPLLYIFSFGLLGPVMHQRIKRFQHTESRFGATSFSFDARISQFYMTYLKVIGTMLLGFIAIVTPAIMLFGASIFKWFSNGHDLANLGVAVGMMLLMFATVIAIYLWMFAAYPLSLTLFHNLIWNHTKLGPHPFSSNMRWGQMYFIAITNVLGIAFTLGLFIPFAQLRTLRYRLESLHIQVSGGLDHFIADNQEQAGATGEGMADLLDFDLSL